MKVGVRIWGCSFDGFKDHTKVDGNCVPCWSERGFRPADVILPTQAKARFKTGIEAKRSRVASGLGWPPEARVNTQVGFRRVPIPLAWRTLIDAGDRTAYWFLENGLSFSVASILANHIRSVLDSRGASEQLDRIVIAIPNDLEETGQESLIREMRGAGFAKLELLWRPVAAALAWLDAVQMQIPSDFGNDDCIVIVHVGPDVVECVSLRLRERNSQNGRRFIVPLRDVPQESVSACGSDWAFGLCEKAADGSGGFGCAWQVFSSFPEVWEALAQRETYMAGSPRAWHCGNSWRLWTPQLDLGENIWKIPAARPKLLRQWLRNGCRFSCESAGGTQGWGAFLRDEVKKTVEAAPGRVWGLILSGPLVARDPLIWLGPLGGLLREKGLDMEVVSDPTVSAIWAPTEDRNIIAEGAFIYGCRRENKEPTYLDTLPALDLLVGVRGNYEWRPLADVKECEGGKPYVKLLAGEFNLPRHSRQVAIYLRKGGKGAFRKAIIRFPIAPEQDVPLDTWVTMAPASGRAEVEFRPASKGFLGVRPVDLDYAQMAEVTELELPTSQRGWPPIVKMDIDREATWLPYANWWGFRSFLQLDFASHLYCDFLEGFKKDVKKPSRLVRNGEFVNVAIVDQDGRAGTPEAQTLIDQTVAKLGDDLRKILSYRGQLPYDRNVAVLNIRQAATWLYAAAPQEVVEHLVKELRREVVTANDVFDAAGRAFVAKEDISLLYKAIERRLDSAAQVHPFPIQAQRAITNLLTYREIAPDALSAPQAKRFTEKARDSMQRYREENRFSKGFFQAVHLFIGLLRFRIVDCDFLSPEKPKDKELFQDITTCLESAQKRLPDRAAKLIREVEHYMFFKGSDVAILQTLSN